MQEDTKESITMLDKTRKKRIEKITVDELLECYKYYYKAIPLDLLRQQISSLKRFAEKRVYEIRNSKKKVNSQDELVYIDYLSGMRYPSLIKKHKLSRRGIAKAIYNTRKAVIDDIKKDVAKGFLVYNP